MVPALLALALSPASVADTTWIYEIEGTDTVAAEQYWDVAGGIRGRIVVRRPALREATYTVRTGEDGLPDVVGLEWVRHAPEGEQIEASFTATIADGRVQMTDSNGTRVGEYPVPENAVPVVGQRPIAYGMLELLARATPADGRRTVSLLIAGQPEPVAATLTRSGDTFRLETPSLRVEATLENGALSASTARLIGAGSLRTYRAESAARFSVDAFLRGGSRGGT